MDIFFHGTKGKEKLIAALESVKSVAVLSSGGALLCKDIHLTKTCHPEAAGILLHLLPALLPPEQTNEKLPPAHEQQNVSSGPIHATRTISHIFF